MNSGKIEPEARKDDYVIQMQQIYTRFGEKIVHDGVDLQVRRGDIFAIVGGSGSGKSTFLREMILLHKPDSGSVKILGMDLDDMSERMTKDLRQRCGVLFQKGGLFGTLTVSENIGLPLREHTDLDDVLIDQVALWKLVQTGLQSESASLYPAELSGGMLKRAAMARALALDPELLFLDEPTAGLDPTSADGIDTLILQLHAVYRPTIVMITHDLDLLWQVTHQVAVLGEGKVLAVGSMMELSQLENPEIRACFAGARGRAAQEQASNLAANHTINVNDKKVPAWKPK